MENKLDYLCDNYRHLICLPYSIENLHRMAIELDLKKCWFHTNHYDIPKRRIKEIKSKCKIISSQDLITIIIKNDEQPWIAYQDYLSGKYNGFQGILKDI